MRWILGSCVTPFAVVVVASVCCVAHAQARRPKPIPLEVSPNPHDRSQLNCRTIKTGCCDDPNVCMASSVLGAPIYFQAGCNPCLSIGGVASVIGEIPRNDGNTQNLRDVVLRVLAQDAVGLQKASVLMGAIPV
eukprot:6077317-Amphidinium_carterae.1